MTPDDLRADIQRAARTANILVYGWPFDPHTVITSPAGDYPYWRTYDGDECVLPGCDTERVSSGTIYCFKHMKWTLQRKAERLKS